MSEVPRALVVDDDPAMRLMVGDALEQEGFAVTEACDGEEALEAFAAARPSLIVMDVLMPRRDGYSACTALRAEPRGALTPILMMTGLDDTEAIEAAYAAGATDFVTKPVNYALLVHRVRYLMRASDAIRGLADSERRLARAQRVARLGYWERHGDGLHWSENVYRMLGLSPARPFGGIEGFLAQVPEEDRVRVRDWLDSVAGGRFAASITHRMLRGDGSECFVRQQVEPDSSALHGTLQDITELRHAEERIHRLAYFDALTGLPNREYFRNRVDLMARLARRRHRQFALLYLDLVDFKRVNESLGHDVGDEVLRTTARRLLQGLRATDLLDMEEAGGVTENLARVGGDEFTLVVPDLRQGEDAAYVARRIIDALSPPLMLQGHEVHAVPSVGIALYPADGEDADTLLKNADMAMYHARRQGAPGCEFFNPSMNAAALRRLGLESELRRAVEREELALHYQPQVDLGTGAVSGLEALLRWSNESLGPVPPAEFIPVAEDSGLIFALGEWVLAGACRQLRAWDADGTPIPRVAVNVSALQFARPGFVDVVARALAEAGLEAHRLELEVTEGLLMRDADESVRTLNALKDLGVQIAIDDFGTGYSSLSYLKRFPIDCLKIDRAFVTNINTDPDDAAIAGAVINLAESMRLRVVAEGVETAAQLEALRVRRCAEVQGFLVSRPLPASELAAFLGTRAAADAAGPRTGPRPCLVERA
jgi:diguanylate cyclase (GGDEF)-like protein